MPQTRWVDSPIVPEEELTNPAAKKTEVKGPNRRIRSILPAGHWAYILYLLVPLGLVDVLLLSARITGKVENNGTALGSPAYFDQIASDVFFYVALIAFWVGVFAVARRRLSRRIAIIGLHATFTLLAFVIVLTELYYIMLDVTLNSESFQLVSLIFQVEMLKIIQAELKSFIPILALIGVLIANLFPVIVNRKHKPRWLSQIPTGWVRPAPARRIALLSGVVVLAFLALSTIPNFQGTTNFTRNRVVSITMDSISKKLADKPAGFVQPTAADIPEQTTLVPTSKTRKYNIVQIVLESERWKSTTLADPSLDTTPAMADLAKTSLSATRAYTTMPHTTKSLIGSNCGVAPPLDTSNSEAKPGGLAARCLPSLLDEQGYNSAFFQAATKDFENREKVVKGFGYKNFFPLESFSKKGFHKTNTLGYEDDIMVKPSLDWAKKQAAAKTPFTMEFMTLTAHSEYVMPKGFKTEHYTDDTSLNNYLNGVRYQDRFVGKIIDGFKKAGLYDNTIFVVMADHGEGFREHGRRLHNDTIWNEGVQIPLVIHAPDRWQNGATLDTPVQNMSMLQTLVDLLGYDIKGGTYHASSMLKPDSNPNPLITGCWDIDQCLAYFEPDGHKYIYFFDYKQPEYFDLNADPKETKNLYDTLSDDKQEKLKALVLRWQAEVNATHSLSRKLALKS